jgi:hypothetical protein
LQPQPDERAYVADVVLLPLAPFLKPQKTNAPRLGEAYDIRGCAGAICTPYHEVSTPIRVSLAA